MKPQIKNLGKIKKHLNLFFSEYKPSKYGKGYSSWERNKTRNKDIVLSRYKNETYQSIAKRYNTSRQHIYIIEYSILDKVIKWFNTITPNSM